MAEPWRTTPLPPNWTRTRRRILERDGHRCTADRHHPYCDGTATEVDHIHPAHLNGPDTDDNLASLNRHCHRTKTAAEAGRQAATRRSTRREPESHPGLT